MKYKCGLRFLLCNSYILLRLSSLASNIYIKCGGGGGDESVALLVEALVVMVVVVVVVVVMEVVAVDV